MKLPTFAGLECGAVQNDSLENMLSGIIRERWMHIGDKIIQYVSNKKRGKKRKANRKVYSPCALPGS